jgi:hypothetical protein
MSNPYDPSLIPLEREARSLLDIAMAGLRLLGKLVVAVLFSFLVAGAIWAFYNGFAIIVILGSFGLIVVAALFFGKNVNERILIITTIAAAVTGGWCGYILYFRMFSLQWFESLFNGKDLGPLGLIAFVLLGGLLSALLIEAYVRRLIKVPTDVENGIIAEQGVADEALDQPL